MMEYVAGGTLAALIKEQGRLNPKTAAAIVAEVADGLETAHAAGLIHRDIKPSNILVDSVSGRAKITDFGLARSTEHSGLTQESTVAGTPTHMSPEQARGGKGLDRRWCGRHLLELGRGRAPAAADGGRARSRAAQFPAARSG